MKGPPSTVVDVIEDFNRVLVGKAGELGLPAGSTGLKRYQVYVARELVGVIEEGERFVIVSMPTG
ncbi:MAG: hypothetical protein LM564_00960, partial [Desulfurococcaceae archaeon]|nr:hypothetical protein [Desulfurococcaceae archaeon]